MSGTPAVGPNPLVVVDRASMRFGARQVLAETSLEVGQGARLGVIGESGSGKTTLARLLVGLLAPTSGSVTVDGDPWRAIRRQDPRRGAIQLIQQDPFAQLSPHLSALSTVIEAVRIRRRATRADARELAVGILADVGLTDAEMRRRPRELSGGQCQRVAIARGLAADAAVLVADEPTSALDLTVQAQILNLLLQLTSAGTRGLVLVSHDLAVIRHLTEEVLVIHQGVVVERGSTMRVFASPQHAYTRRLLESAPWAFGNVA